jgi:hypothetical protein
VTAPRVPRVGMTLHPDDLAISFRVLPRDARVRHLVHAHLEAHDHLAVATDLPDGSIEISGPAARADELDAVVREIAHAVGLLAVEPGRGASGA